MTDVFILKLLLAFFLGFIGGAAIAAVAVWHIIRSELRRERETDEQLERLLKDATDLLHSDPFKRRTPE